MSRGRGKGDEIRMRNDLERFATAQAPVRDEVRRQLSSGRKTSHWMWFVFPQLRGLGRSQMSTFYGLDGIDEARAFLHHPVLALQLHANITTLLTLPENDPVKIFGEIDALKLRSHLTLFDHISLNKENIFHDVLDKYYSGVADEHTLSLLG